MFAGGVSCPAGQWQTQSESLLAPRPALLRQLLCSCLLIPIDVFHEPRFNVETRLHSLLLPGQNLSRPVFVFEACVVRVSLALARTPRQCEL